MFGFQLTSRMGPFAATKLLCFPRVWMEDRCGSRTSFSHKPNQTENPTPRRDEYA